MTSPKICLVLSDIDGTLVTSDKVLTNQAIRAVDELREAGILFAIASSRPPRGLEMYVAPLQLATPLSAFNGGVVVTPAMHVTDELLIDDDVIEPMLALLRAHDVTIWIYRGKEWYVLNANGPHVQHEADVCQFQPLVVANFDDVTTKVAKIVGVHDDAGTMKAAHDAISERFADRVSATNSQPYYLDITNPHANKGMVVDYLSKKFDIPTEEIATIGDAHNDVSMFERSGLSVAMGNAVADVQAAASQVTSSHDDEGFARAVQRFILS
jgi:Cof subfamily protein (haloacid dehalogenase superfamily)